MSELDLMREQAKAGMSGREMLIDSYRREWLEDPTSAHARLEKWAGTTTGECRSSTPACGMTWPVLLSLSMEGQMSAECMKCGHDLPYEGDCEFCSLRSRLEKAEEALGLADELRSRLPEPKRVGDELLRPDLCIAVEDGEWEIEFCPLDVKRNICLRRPSLTEALQAVLNHDDEALASHPEEPK